MVNISHTCHRRPAVRRTAAVLALVLGLAGTTLAAKSGSSHPDPATAVVAAARSHLGDPYVWGAVGPKQWDCSGLVETVWETTGGVTGVPRVAADQQKWAVPIPAEQAQPGDLAFFGNPVSHVGIITGRVNGALQMIDASWSRKSVVERAVWYAGGTRFGRVPRPGMPPVKPWTQPVVPAPTPAPTAAPTVGSLAAALAKKQIGRTKITDAALVQLMWVQAGGLPLPSSKAHLLDGSTAISRASAQPGDLVVYGPGILHVGIYEGNGMMVDASRLLGHVVFRKVWASTQLQFFRIAT